MCGGARFVYTIHMSSTTANRDFELPNFYYFPPFFTIQPVLATREKQLEQWRDLILKYHAHHKIKTLVLHDCPLWKNATIGRELDPEGIRVIMNDFVKSGYGEWEDSELRTRCRIFWRKPEQLAEDIYDWAMHNGYKNGVCTVFELHSGEDVNGTSFQGVDEQILRRALEILEHQGKCTMFRGQVSSEDGIKFF